MTFGSSEFYNNECISYMENLDMLLHDLQSMGYRNLTKEQLNKIVNTNFSISRLIRLELFRILDNEVWWNG